jgi:protein kinase
MVQLRHINIVRLLQVVRERDQIFMVIECCESSLYHSMRALQTKGLKLTEDQIRWAMKEMLNGIAYMHEKGFIHRDIKPENLLINYENLKLCDFGQVKHTSMKPPYTDYISTRWYRAPEVLLKATKYTTAVDMWGFGTLMAELYIQRPLFNGNSEVDQLFKISSVLGTPEGWREGDELASRMNYKWPPTTKMGLKSIIHGASAEGLDLMESLLTYEPGRRITAANALRHPFFSKGSFQRIDPAVNESSMSREEQDAINKQFYENDAGAVVEIVETPRVGNINKPETTDPNVVFGEAPKDAANPKSSNIIRNKFAAPIPAAITDEERAANGPESVSNNQVPSVSTESSTVSKENQSRASRGEAKTSDYKVVEPISPSCERKPPSFDDEGDDSGFANVGFQLKRPSNKKKNSVSEHTPAKRGSTGGGDVVSSADDKLAPTPREEPPTEAIAVAEQTPLATPKGSVVGGRKPQAAAKVDSIISGVLGGGVDSDEEFAVAQSSFVMKPSVARKSIKEKDKDDEFW